MPVKPVASLATIYIVLAAIMWQGYAATQATRELPVHNYPAADRQVTTGQVRPQAIGALEYIHSTEGLPDERQAIIVRTESASHPVLQFIRQAITHRGGAAAMECGQTHPTLHHCLLKAALPPAMAQELKELRHADFGTMQQWIEQQPAGNAWAQQDAELVPAYIRFELPRVSVWPIRNHHANVTALGYLTVMGTAIMMAGVALAIVMGWLNGPQRTGQRPREHGAG